MFSVIIIDLITCVITIIMIIIIMIIMIIMCVIIVKILHRWYVQSGAGDVPHGPQRNWACNAYIHIYIYIYIYYIYILGVGGIRSGPSVTALPRSRGREGVLSDAGPTAPSRQSPADPSQEAASAAQQPTKSEKKPSTPQAGQKFDVPGSM